MAARLCNGGHVPSFKGYSASHQKCSADMSLAVRSARGRRVGRTWKLLLDSHCNLSSPAFPPGDEATLLVCKKATFALTVGYARNGAECRQEAIQAG